MGLSVKCGTIASPAATGSQGYTGVGFTPKVLILFGSGTSHAVDTWEGAVQTMYGVATSSTQEWSVSMSAIDNNTTSDTAICFANVVLQSMTAGAIIFSADLTSFDADGFTLNWTATAASGVKYYYMALGGSDITNAKCGTFTVPTSGATVSSTDPGFLPEFLMVATTNAGGASAGTPIANLTTSIGFTDGTSQGVVAVASEDAQGTSDTYRAEYTDAIGLFINQTNGSEDGRFDFDSFDANGFTLGISNNPSTAFVCGYLAIAGGRWKVGVETQATSNTTRAETGVGFEPDGLFIASAGNTAQASVQAHNTHSFGMSDGTSSRSTASQDLDAQPNMVNATRHSETDVLVYGTAAATASSSTTTGRATLSSFDSDGFTLSWTSTDGNAREFIYFAVAADPAATFLPKVLVI